MREEDVFSGGRKTRSLSVPAGAGFCVCVLPWVPNTLTPTLDAVGEAPQNGIDGYA